MRLVSILSALFLLFVSSSLASMQAPTVDNALAAKVDVPTVAPKLSVDDQLLLQTLVHLGILANTECQKLESAQRYNSQRTAVIVRLEVKYPGYTLNWGTGALEPCSTTVPCQPKS